MTAYLIHSIPLAQSAVQIFAGDKMTVVAHLVGLEQIGYEKILGMSMGVSIFGSCISNQEHSIFLARETFLFHLTFSQKLSIPLLFYR